MRTRQLKKAVVVGAVIVSVVLLNLAWAAQDHSMHGSHTAQMAGQKLSLSQIHSKTIPHALQALATAKKAVQAGHKAHALAELQKIELALQLTHQTLAQHVQPSFVNATCPIMGSKINPAKITTNLVREYKGQKVAFCCAGCPSAWDKLSNAKKIAKLDAAKHESSPSHNHVENSGHVH
jgi:hypothetical protein